MSLREIEQYHFNLTRHGYRCTSNEDAIYNCVAWAADDTSIWWDHSGFPATYWPEGIPRGPEIENYVAVFLLLGYEPCESRAIEPGYEKVAIYGMRGVFKHVAKTAGSEWSSKLGKIEDVEHPNLEALEDPFYGQVVQVLRRLLPIPCEVNP
jgi:hypothetical protein